MRLDLISVIVVAASLPTLAAGPATQPTPGLHQPYRITPRSGAQHVALDADWRLGWRESAIEKTAQLADQNQWISVERPMSVQMALYHAGKFPHPYVNLNSKQYTWVDEKVWYYRKSFSAPPVPEGGHAFLCFEGIDYFARIWLNGEPLGSHQGMFGGPAIEVNKLLKPGGENEVVVEVRAANWGNKKGFDPRKPGSIIKPWVLTGGVGAEMFFPMGMWQGARLEVVSQIHLERPLLVTHSADNNSAQVELNVEVFTAGHSLAERLHPWGNSQLAHEKGGFRNTFTSKPMPGEFELEVKFINPAGGPPALAQRHRLELYEGRNWVKRELTLANPRLWWPNGMGQPDLYRVQLSLLRDGKLLEAIEFDYGVRKLQTIATPGPRTADRWANWQFVVNGQKLFVKGINWMPADILLDLPRERYRWLLEMAKSAGIQMLRVWGGGLIETEEFYRACNELGLLVWQDFPIGNCDTPQWPQDVWEAQVMQTIFRIRNHPALAVYCGGNEFNPYSLGNAASIGIFERCVAEFDPSRPMRRTSPDDGSLHTYPDMDPTWYGHMFRHVPYVSETGMHNIPDPTNLREVVNKEELAKPLTGMFDKTFPAEHPDLMHHFVEYQPSRVPRMLSRASQIADMSAPTVDALAEGTQIGAGEFYQIFSEQLQTNYPVTAGLMPWVYKRPWPVIAIMLVDGFGHPTAPYYFLKRTYEPTHILVKLPHLMWARGEQLPLDVQVLHAGPAPRGGLIAQVSVLDRKFKTRLEQRAPVSLDAGPSVKSAGEWRFSIPDDFENSFFFVIAELKDESGAIVSRSVYWPRCLAQMADPGFARKYRESPQPALALDKGPWLKAQTAACETSLSAQVLEHRRARPDRSSVRIRLQNTGKVPAFNVQLDIVGTRRSMYASDNYLWLAPGEQREVSLEVLWREPSSANQAQVEVKAWNAQAAALRLE